MGDIPWANFDGVHYLAIAQNGYGIYQQAFFPLFPILINIVHNFLKIEYVSSGLLLANTFALLSVIMFYKLVRFDYGAKVALWSIIFFLVFPTSFFLGSVYTESLFLFFIFSSFYFARKGKFFYSAVFGMFATATKFIGILLIPAVLWEIYMHCKEIKKTSIIPYVYALSIIPLGLLFYMFFLNSNYSDPLLFIHTQSAFGVNRTAGEVILLPQVLFRYLKIFISVPFSNYELWVAVLEFVVFLTIFILLLKNIKKIRLSYLIFSSFAIIIPTLSGTLSSLPRYALAAFPVFIILGRVKSTKIKIFLLIISYFLLIILTSLFLRGYFVA